MQEVCHNVAFENAVLGQELRTEVFVEDGFVVREVLDDFVRGGDLSAVLVIWRVARGEDSEKQDLGIRSFFLQCSDAEADAVRSTGDAALARNL